MEQIKQQVVYLKIEKDNNLSVCRWHGDNYYAKSHVKEENGYFFTEIQLRELLKDAVDTGGDLEGGDYRPEGYEEDREEYINKLLSK